FFIGITGVKFGGVPARSFTVNSITQITAVTPPFLDSYSGPHAVDVSVTTALGSFSGTSTLVFRYSPVVSKVSPNSGPMIGGTVVTVTGAGFEAVRGAAIYFGTHPATNVYCTDSTSCTAAVPASAAPGVVD